MNYSKKTIPELKAICKERKIKGISGKRKNALIYLIEQNESEPKNKTKHVRQINKAKTDVKIIPPVKVKMDWISWSEKSKDIPFKSTITGVGDGEQKMSHELDTPFNGQNSSYDMMPILNGIKTKCEVKKLDKQNDFNTGKEGRDILRPIKMLHTTFLDSLNLFLKSDLFTPQEKVELVRVENVSPDELAVGTLRQLEQICVMLNLKKKTICSTIPLIPFTACCQEKEMPLDLYYSLCQKMDIDFPNEFSSYIDTILILQKMDHIYIDEPTKFMEDLHTLVGKLFLDIKIIIVDMDKGYMILPDTSRIKFYRITRGNPRFQVMF